MNPNLTHLPSYPTDITLHIQLASQFNINNPISSIITPPSMSKSNPEHYDALQVFSTSLWPNAQVHIVKDLINKSKSPKKESPSPPPSRTDHMQPRSRSDAGVPSQLIDTDSHLCNGQPRPQHVFTDKALGLGYAAQSNSMKGPVSKSPSSKCLKRMASAFPDPNSDQKHLFKNNNFLGKLPLIWWSSILMSRWKSFQQGACPSSPSIWCWIALSNNQRNGITGMWRLTRISACPHGQGCYLLVVPLCPILWWESV